MDSDRPVVFLTGFFLAANVLGVAAGTRLYGTEAVQQASAAYQSPVSGLWFFGALVLATVLLLALYRYRKQLLVKLWFGSALVVTAFILFDAFFPPLPALAATALFAVVRFRTRNVQARNALDVASFAGAGALFGSLIGLQAALVFLALLSVYDYIAVNNIGHMVELARHGAETDTFMGFTAPGAAEKMDTVAEDRAVEAEGGQVGVLGGGDVVIPIVLAVAVIPVFGVGAAVATVVGATTALFLFFTVIQRRETERFYPAIPVVGGGALFGLALWLLLVVAGAALA